MAFVPLSAQDWPMYLRDLAHSSYARSETMLDGKNIAALQPGWTLHSPGPLASAVTISNGTLYFGDWKGNFSAVDVRSGKALWTKFLGEAANPPDPTCQPAIGVTSQAAVVGSAVYVGGGDSAIYALDQATGNQLWRVPLADPRSGSYIWSSVVPFGGALYVGVASLGDCPLVRGLLARIDLTNPQQPILQYLVPSGGLGAGVWSTPAIDQSTKTVFINNGNGDPQNPSGGVWTDAMLSLDATALRIKSSFFLPADEALVDMDWGSSPVLLTPPAGPPMVTATAKDGYLYALRANDLSPVWQTKLAVGCVDPEQGCGSISTPAFDGSTLFAGAGVRDPNGFAKGSVYAINPADGAVIWEHDTDGTVIAPVTASNGLVFVSTTEGLEIYDAPTGQCIWTDGKRGLLFSQPVLVNGTVYSTYFNGELVSWKLPADTSGVLYSTSSASGLPSLAPGAIATSYGINLAGNTIAIQDSAGVQWETAAIYAASGMISYVVPDGMSLGRAIASATSSTGVTLTGPLQVGQSSPGIFSANSDGKGVAAAQVLDFRADGTREVLPVYQCGSAPGSCLPVPIDLGSGTDQVFLVLYGTGLRGRSSLDRVQCTIGGIHALVTYAGPQGDIPGLDQINVLLPSDLRGAKTVNIVLSVDGQLANTVTGWFQ